MIAHARAATGETPGFVSVPERLRERIEALERRLEDGDRRITDASARGEIVAAWEEFWIDLLHEYETLCGEPVARIIPLPAYRVRS